MRYAILHISDLHRDIENEICNTVLVESIAKDIRRYDGQKPCIEIPVVCIVSGDLIYGVRPDSSNPSDELIRQYNQAEDFLERLTDQCFGGNRAKVILVPGNHDVCYDAVMRSTSKIDIPNDVREKQELVKELFKPKSKLRWSWDELCFFRIENEDAYNQRLSGFAETYRRFYQNHRTFSIDPKKQFDVFTFPELQLSVLMLNSCFNNDPLRRVAAFHPSCIAEALPLFREPHHTGHLIVSTWHHSLSGMPYEDDYLGMDILQVLVDADVSIGLHGHQHKSYCIDERNRIGTSGRKITVIGTGTLCSGPHGLAPGNPRCYNIIEIDTESWEGRVHQRKMVNNDFDLPIWGPGQFNETNMSYMDFKICPPNTTRSQALDISLALEQAEKHIGLHQWDMALHILQTIAYVPLARPMITKALFELGDYNETIDMLWPPTTPAEAVMIGGAMIEVGTPEQVSSFMSLDFIKSSSDASIRDIVRRMQERRIR